MPLFRKGEVILSSEPYAAALYGDNIDSTCSYCFAIGGILEECPTCLTFNYCTAECRMKDSYDHWLECQAMKNAEEIPSIEVRMLLRSCVRMLREEAAGVASVEYAFGYCRSIHYLMTHEEDIAEETRSSFWSTVEAAKKFIRGIYEIEDSVMFTMLNRISINCHDMTCPRNYVFGRVMYLGASKLNHTCEVHDRYVQQFQGRTYAIRALQDIVVNDVDDIMISYLPLMMNCKHRREHLKDGYYFDCDCDRCLRELKEAQTLNCESELAREITDLLDSGEPVEPEQFYQNLLECHKRVEHLADKDFHKYRLILSMMFACFDTDRLTEGIYLALRALSVSLSVPEMEQVLDKLCEAATAAKWHNPRHPKFQDFLMFTKLAVTHFSASRGLEDFIAKGHRLTLKNAMQWQKNSLRRKLKGSQ